MLFLFVFFEGPTFRQRVEVLLHEALHPLQVELDQHVVELGALVLPHVDDVLQVGDGQLLEALLQEVQHFVPGQGLHLRQVLGEDLERAADQISSRETRRTAAAAAAAGRALGVRTFRPSSGQIFNTQGENSKMMPRFSTPVWQDRNQCLALMEDISSAAAAALDWLQNLLYMN